MRIIGLTGGIASGKSTVAQLLRSRGVEVIDADQLARDVVVPGMPALARIVAEFGEGVLADDGTLNRKALGEIVFGNPEQRRRLEAITHPAIRALAAERLSRVEAKGADRVVYMAPLLIEAGSAIRTDEIWVVYLDRETQLARLMDRDGLDRDAALARLAAQMPMEEKVRHGTVVIDNTGTFADLEKRVREAWKRELEKTEKKNDENEGVGEVQDERKPGA